MKLPQKLGPEWIVLCVLLVGAAVIAASGHDGWGWFIFLAVLLMMD